MSEYTPGDSRMIRACPVCGLEVRYTCFHDGEDVPSVLMDAEAARRLQTQDAQ